MASVPPMASPATRRRRRLTTGVKESLRELRIQLALLNYHVSAELELKNVDLDCLEMIARHGPLSPSALARRTGLHPATMTGILDRLQRGGWVTRERSADTPDRRAVAVRALRARTGEVFRLYEGMNSSMDAICARYTDAELELLSDFMRRATDASRGASEGLADRPAR